MGSPTPPMPSVTCPLSCQLYTGHDILIPTVLWAQRSTLCNLNLKSILTCDDAPLFSGLSLLVWTLLCRHVDFPAPCQPTARHFSSLCPQNHLEVTLSYTCFPEGPVIQESYAPSGHMQFIAAHMLLGGPRWLDGSLWERQRGQCDTREHWVGS